MDSNSDINDDSSIEKLFFIHHSFQSKAYRRLVELQAKIRRGESTGDRIRDFMIVNLGTISIKNLKTLSLSPKIENQYRETDARLRNRAGSQILVVKQDKSFYGRLGVFQEPYIIFNSDPMYIGIDTELRLGVLTSGLELDIKEGKIILPTDRHVRMYHKYAKNSWELEDKWELEEGPISFSWYGFMNLGKEVQRGVKHIDDLSDYVKHGLMFYLGEEVEQYFSRNGLLDASYVEALNLLGKEAPENFRKKYDETVYQKRVCIILNKLEELRDKELVLDAKIRSIEFLAENENDAKVASMEPRKKLKETREEIQRYLGQAVELGMYKRELRIEPRPGFVVNVPLYISDMCEEYKVELKK